MIDRSKIFLKIIKGEDTFIMKVYEDEHTISKFIYYNASI